MVFPLSSSDRLGETDKCEHDIPSPSKVGNDMHICIVLKNIVLKIGVKCQMPPTVSFMATRMNSTHRL